MSDPNIKAQAAGLTPEQLHEQAQKKVDAQRQQASSRIPNDPAAMAGALATAGVSSETLEDIIKRVLDNRKVEAVQQFSPKEPDYKALSEKDIFTPGVYIPVIEHDIPDYMNVILKDEEYVPIWVNRDQRQLGAKLAEGFEFLKREHLPEGYQAPLKFDSEGLYIYQDVVCMRVHKRIRFAKLRRFAEMSKNQLKPAQAQENAKGKLMEQVILGDPALDQAFASGAYKFYHTDT
ncbi:MAG TPA: hypothetical protein VII99_10550 [Bacteroidia bacterium]